MAHVASWVSSLPSHQSYQMEEVVAIDAAGTRWSVSSSMELVGEAERGVQGSLQTEVEQGPPPLTENEQMEDDAWSDMTSVSRRPQNRSGSRDRGIPWRYASPVASDVSTEIAGYRVPIAATISSSPSTVLLAAVNLTAEPEVEQQQAADEACQVSIATNTFNEDLTLCKICYSRVVDVAIIPCGHCLCTRCHQRILEELQKNNTDSEDETVLRTMRCFICKTLCEDTLRLYL